MPPISTDGAGLRACWVKLGGAVLSDLAQHARLEPDEHAVDLGAGPLPVVERHRIVAELDADLGQDAIGRRLDLEEVFFAEDVVGRDVADDIGPAKTIRAVRTQLPPGLAATRAFATLARFRGLVDRNNRHRRSSLAGHRQNTSRRRRLPISFSRR